MTEAKTLQLSERAASVPEYADFLGVTLPTVYRESHEGRLVITKVGRRSVILPAHQREHQERLARLHAPKEAA